MVFVHLHFLQSGHKVCSSVERQINSDTGGVYPTSPTLAVGYISGAGCFVQRLADGAEKKVSLGDVAPPSKARENMVVCYKWHPNNQLN